MGNEPAFPLINPKFDGNWDKEPIIHGLTKLEYASIEAMKGLVASYDGEFKEHSNNWIRERISLDAIDMAKALLAELEKEQ